MLDRKMNYFKKDIHVRRAFSRAAKDYDTLTGLHQDFARRLLNGLPENSLFEEILDVGMGTGWMTQKLRDLYPRAQITGIDFSDGMVHFAKENCQGINYVLADARRLPFQKESFDLILSNMAYQWVPELPEAFQVSYDSLKDEGVFHFALFGEKTYCELFESLARAKIVSKDTHKPLVNQDTVSYSLLSAGFNRIEVTCEKNQLEFRDMMDLLRWTKRIGANRLHAAAHVGKEALQKAAYFYEKEYSSQGKIPATFEIILGKGKK